MRDSFVFYGSFYEALSEIDDDSVRLAVYDAVAGYALTGIVPELSGTASALFKLIKPVIDANNKRREDGCLGGRPKTKPMVTKNDENQKPMVTKNGQKTKPDKDEDEDEERDEDIDNSSLRSLAASDPPPAAEIPLKNEEMYPVTEADIAHLQESFKGIDVLAEIKKAAIWCENNPAKRKTRAGVMKFLTNWLLRAGPSPKKQQRFDERIYAPGELEALVPNALDAFMDERLCVSDTKTY